MLIATPEAVLSLVQDNLLYQHNEGKQISENQYFHVDTSLFLTYYIQKTGCELGIYILITGVYCSITFGFLCFIIRRYVHSILLYSRNININRSQNSGAG